MATIDDIQKKLSAELEKYKIMTKDCQKQYAMKQQLDGQLNENVVVDEELGILTDKGVVYKLNGPVLIKQDVDEAKQNVAKRIEFIKKELKRVDDTLAELDEKGEKQRETIGKLQNQLRMKSMNAPAKGFSA